MSSPRTSRSVASSAAIMSRPRYSTEPVISALSGNRRTVDSAVTDFPDPLSPTIASVSPACSSKLTPRTAFVTLPP